MIKIVVPISGGKDSQSCAKLALEHYEANEIRGLFCDTQFEHPLTYQHIKNIEKWYGIKIDKVTAGTVQEKVLKYQRFPTDIIRFCTEELKIIPSKKYYKKLAEEQGGFEVWYGMRSGESTGRARRYKKIASDEVHPPHEIMPGKYPQYLHKLGVSFRLPILNWSEADVLAYLDGLENPLYGMGQDRVGCFPCLAGGGKSMNNAFNMDEFGQEQKQKVIWLEKQIGKKHQNLDTSQMCMFCQI